MSWKGHWTTHRGKPFGLWSGTRLVETVDEKYVNGNESSIKKLKYEGWRPRSRTLEWHILKMMRNYAFKDEAKVSKEKILDACRELDQKNVVKDVPLDTAIKTAVDKLVNKEKVPHI